MLEVENLSKIYTISTQNKVIALNNINFSIKSCGFVAVTGKSGSGKTTLLHILGGLDDKSTGTLKIDGKELDFHNGKQLDLYRNYTVSFVFQDYNLLEDYSVYENIYLGLKLQGVKRWEAYFCIKDALKSVGLEGFENRKICTLSGGQKQRVAIARALCRNSKIVLCDEPTGNLDSNTSDEIFSLIKSLSETRLFVVVTHDEESAKLFADRIIKLSDGVIVEDTIITKAFDKTLSKIEEKANSPINIVKKQKNYVLGFLQCLQMIWHNISHSIFSSTAISLLLIACFTLVSIFVSLSQYDEKTSFNNTLKANGQYTLSITKYVDRPILTASGKISHGYNALSSLVKQSDIVQLKADLPSEINVYSSYYYAKPFSDFRDVPLNLWENGDITDYAYAFKEAVAVENFDNFYSILLYGALPQNDNDVLIYDYMAESLIRQGIIDGNIDTIVGKFLTDTVTGFQMRISGIIKSQYQNYLNLKGTSSNYEFAISYLSSLQSIFCKPIFITSLDSEKSYESIIGTRLEHSDNSRIDIVATKIQEISIENLTFLATAEDYKTQNGIILSASTVANILGIEESALTETMANVFLNNNKIIYRHIVKDESIYPISIATESSAIIGICNENITQYGVLGEYIGIEDYESSTDNYGEFSQIVIGLCDNWKINQTVVNYFWKPDNKTEQFYADNPDFYDELYANYDPSGILIKEANYYLVDVKEFSNTISYIVLGTSFLVVLIYTALTLQKYNYKIGLLKALGARTSAILLIFGLQLLLLSVIAFIISVPCSYFVLLSINNTFIRDINIGLKFFSLTVSSVFVSFIFATVGIVLISTIPLLRLAITSPIKTIKTGKSKL